MRFALAQLNPIVGDLAGNAEKIVRFTQQAKEAGADLVIFPELIVTGYPPMDLLDRPAFLDAVEETVEWLVRELPEGPAVIIGTPVRNRGRSGKRLYNAALLIDQGSIQATILKRLLPTYDVFDEYRYFEPGPPTQPVEWRGLRLGLHICEDMWNNEAFAPFLLYDDNPIDDLAAQGVDVFVNISASPFERGKQAVRTRILRESCCEHDVPFVVVNQTGANTEVVFDGDSRVHGRHGELLLTTPLFEETLAFWDMDAPAPAEPLADDEDELAQVHAALVCGIRDYYHKTGFFDGVLLGLSGGIDSALTAALAVEALGPEHVMGITMPSKYSSSGSVDDSQALADALGIRLEHVSIRPAVDAFDHMLDPLFDGTDPGVAEENIQSRARGLTLMAVSNKFNRLLLTTGNKSEMAVGYATLYGDMSGGLAVLADVLKMDVYRISRRINEQAGRPIIPESTLTKPPSAELRPDQTDQDSLPDYAVLDAILLRYIEQHQSPERIAHETGFGLNLVQSITRKVDQNEYKRRQAAPGLRVTRKAFGIGRRLPIVMRRTGVMTSARVGG